MTKHHYLLLFTQWRTGQLVVPCPWKELSHRETHPPPCPPPPHTDTFFPFICHVVEVLESFSELNRKEHSLFSSGEVRTFLSFIFLLCIYCMDIVALTTVTVSQDFNLKLNSISYFYLLFVVATSSGEDSHCGWIFMVPLQAMLRNLVFINNTVEGILNPAHIQTWRNDSIELHFIKV